MSILETCNKVVLRGKPMTLNTHIREEERFGINELSFRLKNQARKTLMELEASGRKEIIIVEAEIDNLEHK